MISAFFLVAGSGLMLNVIYSSLNNEEVIRFLNILTIFLVTWSVSFLLAGIASINYSNKVLTDRIKIFIVGVAFIGILPLFFIPDGVDLLPPDFTPYWNSTFTIYSLILSQALFWTTFGIGYKAYRNFQETEIKKKFLKLLVGLIFFDYILVQNALINSGVLPRALIVTLLSLLVIPAALLVYVGIGKPVETSPATE